MHKYALCTHTHTCTHKMTRNEKKKKKTLQKKKKHYKIRNEPLEDAFSSNFRLPSKDSKDINYRSTASATGSMY